MPIYHEAQLRVYDQRHGRYVEKDLELKTTHNLTPEQALDRLDHVLRSAPDDSQIEIRSIDTNQ